MTFSVCTLFPEIVEAFFSASIMSKAVGRGLLQCRAINIREFATDKHHKCDDAPYGGGAGMLMLGDPVGRCLEAVGAKKKSYTGKRPRVLYVSPSGIPFTQAKARELAQEDELVIVCGRYEGLDQRIIDLWVDDEISIGDYVLSSGEVAALVVIDAVYRLVDGVISAESLTEESFSDGLLEYPQYTRPEIYDSLRVPDTLLSGNHELIRQWRLHKRVEKTLAVRPDLIRQGLSTGLFNDEVRKIIQELEKTDSGLHNAERESLQGEDHERN